MKSVVLEQVLSSRGCQTQQSNKTFSPGGSCDREVDEYDRRKQAELYGKYISRANLPRRHLETVADREPRWAKAYALASSLVAGGNGVIVALIGNRGTGKTQLAAEIAKDETLKFCSQDRWRPDRFALYSTASAFFQAHKRFYDHKPVQDMVDPIESFLSPRLLIIDEIQVRSGSEWELNQLATLIDSRYAAMRDTILIGNVHPENLASVVGDSATDRMNEGGGMIVMDWESRRGVKNQ